MLFLTLLLLGVQGNAPISAQRSGGEETALVAFVNVAVVSMQDEALLQKQTVLIRGDRIQLVGPADEVAVPAEALLIDGSGGTLIPGLADMHVHVDVPFDDGVVFLDAGITTVLSLGTRSPSMDATLRERERTRGPDFLGPTLYTVGPLIWGGTSPDEAERLVREIAGRGFDMVKVYGALSPEAFDRVHGTARQLGIRVTGHAQRRRGMQPAYAQQQDIAHVEEFLYAALNPVTPGFLRARGGSLIALVLFSLTSMAWGSSSLLRRLRKHRSPAPAPSSLALRKWGGRFTLVAWMLTTGLALILTEPFPGLYAGKTVGVGLVGILVLVASAVAIVFSASALSAWRDSATPWERAFLLVLVGLAWTHVACSAFLTPRGWRSTESGLERIAAEAAAAGIWVTPTLVVLDYNRRQNTDEFHALIERPGMRYLEPGTRSRWINDNEYRVPALMRPMQFAAWRNWTDLMSRLTGKLNEANVPLLAASDATGPHGVLPGSSFHDELDLLVQAGLTPYEALRTATVNPAIYLDAEGEFGRVAAGLRADLVLLAGNPLDDIRHTRSRVGVMRRGRWFLQANWKQRWSSWRRRGNKREDAVFPYGPGESARM